MMASDFILDIGGRLPEDRIMTRYELFISSNSTLTKRRINAKSAIWSKKPLVCLQVLHAVASCRCRVANAHVHSDVLTRISGRTPPSIIIITVHTFDSFELAFFKSIDCVPIPRRSATHTLSSCSFLAALSSSAHPHHHQLFPPTHSSCCAFSPSLDSCYFTDSFLSLISLLLPYPRPPSPPRHPTRRHPTRHLQPWRLQISTLPLTEL